MFAKLTLVIDGAPKTVNINPTSVATVEGYTSHTLIIMVDGTVFVVKEDELETLHRLEKANPMSSIAGTLWDIRNNMK